MDTEITAFENSAQYEFFMNDLEAVDRDVTPWIIFSGHRPMYSSSDQTDGYDLINGPWWPDVEALLLKHEVDLCLWGHVHNAEQTCPLRNGTCVETSSSNEYGGIVHAVIGNAGQSLSAFHNETSWSLWRFPEFGYSSIEVVGRKNLTMRFFADSNHTVVHEFTIQGKNHSSKSTSNKYNRRRSSKF
jgi:acid phosphatase type 7